MHNAARYNFVKDSQALEQHFCHPSNVLQALSTARMDEKIDPVARDAAISVDVGDVTLVRVMSYDFLGMGEINCKYSQSFFMFYLNSGLRFA
jgi:hypothetical protein